MRSDFANLLVVYAFQDFPVIESRFLSSVRSWITLFIRLYQKKAPACYIQHDY
jgi:hypothetical protein